MGYNGSNYYILHNHNNGNVSVNAAGEGLYLGYFNTTNIYCRGTYTNLDSGNYSSYALPLSGGTISGFLTISTNSRNVTLGCQNSSYAHYSTNADTGHWFNKNTYVQGNLYAGSGYNDLVLTEANYNGSLASNRAQATAGGYHQIFINSPNAWMTAFTVRLYQAYKYTDIVISGYNYGTSHWYSPSAVMLGSSTTDGITVYFGYSSDWNLWVGIPATNYFGIEIVDCVNGYTAFDSWKNLFTINHVSSLSGTIQTSTTVYRPWYRGESITGAVWNDYAEFRSQEEQIEPGYCVTSSKNGQVSKTIKRLQYCEGVVSDTYGFSIGETENCKTPLAVSGRVLAYYFGDLEDYDIGDTVCAGPEGKICKMTREEIKEYPDRIVGTVSEIPEYETWGTGNVSTKNRIWIKIK